jgi:TPR repeat protein
LLKGHEGCLEAIPEEQGEVLTLRIGFGLTRSYSRRAVAHMLHISLRREARLERRGVSGIKTAAKHGCPTLQAPAARALIMAARAVVQMEQLVPAALGTSSAGRSSAGGQEAGRRSHTSSKRRHRHRSVAAASTRVQQGAIASPARSGSGTLMWILLAAGLLAATAIATPVARRRGRLSPSFGEGGAAVAEPPAHEAAAAAPAAPAHEAAIATPAAPAQEPAAAGAAAAAVTSTEEVSAARQLEVEGDVEGALAAYQRADAAGDPQGATNLGVLLEQQGDLDGALAAYRRADERGDVNGAFNLGCLLAELGDMPGAIGALRRADERGDPAGASNLGVLLEQQGDLDGAFAAYRRADERGDANGSFNLGLLLAGRGDLAGARDAYRRAAERGDPEVEQRVHSAQLDLDEHGES